MLNKMRKTFQNSVIHSMTDGRGFLSGIAFMLLAGHVRLCYDIHTDDEWDYAELNRDEPRCYFLTGKPK